MATIGHSTNAHPVPDSPDQPTLYWLLMCDYDNAMPLYKYDMYYLPIHHHTYCCVSIGYIGRTGYSTRHIVEWIGAIYTTVDIPGTLSEIAVYIDMHVESTSLVNSLTIVQ